MTTEINPSAGRRTALVTGAASGMGQATAQLLADAGWTVIALDQVPAEVTAAGGDGGVIRALADITDRDAVEAAVRSGLREAPEAEGTIDLVASIAGVYPPSTLETFTEALYRRTFDVNVLGTLNVVAAARERMPRGSAVVTFSSVDAFAVSPGQLLYGASKAAVVMLTKELALELAPAGIRVNGIAPGWVETPGNAATGRMGMAAGTIPLGRVAQPFEIARWVELLAGPDAAFMTGETVVLSGGDVIR